MAVLAVSSRHVAGAARGPGPLAFSVVGKLQTLHGSLALLSNISNNMSNSISLVLKMTVCHVLKAGSRDTLLSPAWGS